MPRNYGERIPVDPRVVDKIQRSSQMMYEQGGDFLTEWGGPQQYKAAAKLSKTQRVAFYAVQEGCKTIEEVAMVTGLSPEQAEKALDDLARGGWVVLEAPKL